MLDIENQIGFNLHRVYILFRRELIKCFRDYNLNPEQWQVMVLLWHKKRLSQTQIIETTLQDLPSVSRMIKRMENNGLIQIERSVEDRRATVISLTKYGQSLEKELIQRALKHFDGILGQLPDDTRKSFMIILKQFRKILGDSSPIKD